MADLAITTQLLGLDAVLAGFNRIENSAKSIGDSFAAAGERLQSVGRSISTSITAPLSAFGALGLKVAGDFEAGMNKVAAISSATGDQLKKMTDLAVTLGAQTKFSAGEAAEGMANLAAAGFDVEEVMKSLGPSMKLAEAVGISLGDATRITGATLNQFKLDASELTRIGDLMVATSNRSAAGMLDLGEAFIKVGPIAKATDQSIEDMLAIIAKLSDAGVQGEVAGTALAAAISRLIEPPKAAREAIEDLNLKIKDNNGTMRSFVDILGDVDKAGASAEQIIALFGIEAGRYLISIKGSAEETRKFSADLATAGGEMDRVGKIMNQGLNYQVEQLMGALESLAIRIGQTGILAELTKLAGGVAEFVDELSRSSPEILKWSVQAAAMAAALGPVTIAAGAFLASLGPISAAVAALLSPMGLATVAVGALVTAFDGWSAIGRAVSDAWASISKFTTDVVNAFSRDGLAGAIDTAGKAFSGLAASASTNLATLGRQLVDTITSQIGGTQASVTESAKRIGTWIGEAIGGGIVGLVTLGRSIVNAVADAITPIEGDIGTTARRVGTWLAEAIPAGIAALSTLGSAIVDAVDKAIDPIRADIGATAQRVGTWIAEDVPAGFRGVSGLASALVSWLDDQLAAFLPQSAKTGESIGRAIGEEVVWAIRGLASIAGELVNWFQRSVDDGSFGTGMRRVLNVIALAFVDLAELVKGVLVGFGDVVLDAIGLELSVSKAGISRAIYANLLEPFALIAGDIQSALGAARDAISRKFDEISEDLSAKQESIRRTFDDFVTWVSETAGRIGDGFVAGFEGVIDRVAQAWDDIKETIRRKVAEIAEVIPAPIRTAMDTVTTTLQTGVETASGVLSSTTETMNRVWTDGLNFFGFTTEQAMKEGVIAPMEAMKEEVVGNSIIPDTVDLILIEWQRLNSLGTLTVEALSPVITAFEDMSRSLDQTFPEDFPAKVDEATFAFGQQVGQLDQLNLTLGETGVAVEDVGRKHRELAAETTTVLGGMRAGWDRFYKDVTDFGTTAKELTTEGLRTIQSTLSDFFRTGKLDTDDFKNFALQAFADVQAQLVMSFAVEGVNAFKTWVFGATEETKKVQAAVEATTTGSKGALEGFATDAQAIFSRVWTFVSEGFTSLTGTIRTLFTDLLGWFGEFWTKLSEGFSGVWKWITDGLGSLGETFKGWFSGTSTGFSGLWETIKGGATTAWDWVKGGLADLGGAAGKAWEFISGSAGNMWKIIGDSGVANMKNIGGAMQLLGTASAILFDDLGNRARGAIGTIQGVGTALASIAAGNPLGVIAGAISALQGLSTAFTSAHDNYSVDIRNGRISTGTNTNPNPQNKATAEKVAGEVNAFLKERGITDRAEVKVDDRGTVISLYGANDFQRTDNNPDVALQQFKNHIIRAGLADGGPVVAGFPFRLPNVRDNVMTPLQIGEFVINRPAAQKYRPLLEAINDGKADGVFNRIAPADARTAREQEQQARAAAAALREAARGGETINLAMNGPIFSTGLSMRQIARQLMREIETERRRVGK